MKFSMRWIKRILKALLPERFKAFYREYRRQLPLTDRTRVILFASPDFASAYPHRVDITPGLKNQSSLKASLIATAFNEAGTLDGWMESLLVQSRRPDEIVISDGGSTDGTLEMLHRYESRFPIPLRVIEAPGANISRGRNLAIEAAGAEVVACTDFGCVLDEHWLRNLLAPFEIDPQIDLSAGYYQVQESNWISRLAREFFGIDLEGIDPQNFLPSGRSLAMKKSLWAQAGGYPEWLTDAAEDTLFDYRAKAQPSTWAFVPQARVSWKAPDTLQKLLKTYARYALGDGETAIAAPLYWYKTVEVARTYTRRLILFLAGLIVSVLYWPWGLAYWAAWLVVAGVEFVSRNAVSSRSIGNGFYPISLMLDVLGVVQMGAFTRGVLNRKVVEARMIAHYRRRLDEILEQHPHKRGVIVYPPTHDWAFMFQRPHQIARAFARQGYLYFYCTDNERTDSVFGFRHVEDSLWLCHLPLETFKTLERPVVYLGSAWKRNDLAHFTNPVCIYDHYDDLQVSGARREDHDFLLRHAEVVLVTSRILQAALHEARPDALLIPNGVDYDMIQSLRPASQATPPQDLQEIVQSGRKLIGYSGALAEWFNYDLLSELARLQPDWEFVLIGVDYDGSLQRSAIMQAPNVHWLGMKAYPDLFRYMWWFDVCTIPFRINEITLSTSPIKLFEYMACQKPVISTALPECKQYPGVLIADTSQEFAEAILLGLEYKEAADYLATINSVARENTWDSRVCQISDKLQDI